MTTSTLNPTPAAAPAPTTITLTAKDRCDAGGCGAQARAVATLPSGGTLVFCRHHTEAQRDALTGAGATLDTQYGPLGVALDSSAV